jgi:hypothetical protein
MTDCVFYEEHNDKQVYILNFRDIISCNENTENYCLVNYINTGMHTVHNEQYQLTVSSTYLFFCRCSSTLLSRPDCFFSCSLVTQGNKPGKFIHSSLLDGPSIFSVNTFPHFFYRFITTLLTSTNGTDKTRVLEQRRVWAHIY